MMTYATAGKEKTHAEVFTPAGLVFDMVMQPHFCAELRDVDKTFFDPAVGEGQFPCAELVCKMFYNVDRLTPALALRAVKSLYGVDIQEKSIKKCRNHLLATLISTYDFSLYCSDFGS